VGAGSGFDFRKEGVSMVFSAIAAYGKIVYRDPDFPFVFDLHRRVNAQYHANLAWHEEMEIKYIRSGSMGINLGSKTVRVHAGDVVIINPYEYHANVLEEGDEAEYDVLCVNPARVFNKNSFGWDLLLDKEMNTRYENVVRGDALLVGMAEQLFASHERGDKLFTLGIFLAFFASLQRHAASQSVSHSKKDARNFEIINSALGYIHAHFDEQIKLSELAKRCFVSEPHFCRVFKAITGETAISYINNLKISKAIALMKNSTQTVKQIAEAVGFEDVAYFCRCFKKKTGAAPKAFLKQ
jgi:AraC-like DNA-binding protein